QAEDGIRDRNVTGVQTCALPIWYTRMYGMVVMMALSQSPAVGQEVEVRPDQARYGNQLQSEHNRILGGRRGCGSSCSSGCNTCRSEERRVGKESGSGVGQ